MTEPEAFRATASEIASCTVNGRGRDDRVQASPVISPLAALEQSVLRALRRPPCLVSFSGGMDSSFVLAVSARIAERDGLPPPVPVTWRFTDAPRADESDWQEKVIAALPNLDWQKLHADDDLDLVGPVAQRVLTRHGVLLPPNVHLHQPIFELATGGSVVTGVGGDQVLIGNRHPPRTARIRAHATRRLIAALRQRRGRDRYPWLRPAVSHTIWRADRREDRERPTTIDKRIEWFVHRRSLQMTCASLDRVASDHRVRVVNPLLDSAFLAALAAQMRGRTDLGRTDLLCAISDGTLPPAATAPRPKAHFLEVFLRTPTRQFVGSWAGRGVDARVVDAAALRRVWSRWPVPAGTAGLVQQLWLSSGCSD